MRLDITPFADEHLDAAAELLAARHQSDRERTPLLSPRFWPHRGFTPALYRLVRRIDARIAWAHR